MAVFQGIPFARPPVGELRFLAPRRPARWDGVLEAVAFGPVAPQALPLSASRQGSGGMPPADDGNWLTLNVWTPDLSAATAAAGGRAEGGLPVLVWVHGGAYIFGSASDPAFDGAALARLGAVVVTCNYRLGVEGFAQVDGAPANRGLLDVVAALEWVAENIGRFGGDPASVTVFGTSSGAGIVAALLAMPAAEGLFRRAIAQSVPGTFFAPDLASDITRAIAVQAGILAAGSLAIGRPPTREALATATPHRLVAAQMAVAAALREYAQWGPVALTVTPFSPVVDGEVLPRAPWRALLSGAARDVDLLVGHNKDEYRLFIQAGGQAGRISDAQATEVLRAFAPASSGAAAYRQAYPDADPERLYEIVFSDWLFRMPSLHLAQAHAASGGRTFLYELTYPAPAAPEALGACHGLDVPLVWGGKPDGIRLAMTGPEPPREFTGLGGLMRAEWLAFALHGEPGWPVYGTERRLARIYGWPPVVDPYPEEVSMRLWERHQFDALGLAGLSRRLAGLPVVSQAAEGTSHYFGIGRLPERRQRRPQEVPVPLGHQAGVEYCNHAAVTRRAQQPPRALREEQRGMRGGHLHEAVAAAGLHRPGARRGKRVIRARERNPVDHDQAQRRAGHVNALP
jgi:para-nitrobenzyl esterase